MEMNLINFDLDQLFTQDTGYIYPEKFENQEDMLEHHKRSNILRKKHTEKVYKNLIEYTKDKTYLELLPKDLISKKRSLIKTHILKSIDSTYEWLLHSPFYNENPITKEQITLYMMVGTGYSNYKLAWKIIPKINSMSKEMEYYNQNPNWKDLSKEEEIKLHDKWREDNKEILDYHADLDMKLSYLRQVWEPYVNRNKIKKGLLVSDHDMEDDDFPRTSRGSMCYLFHPIKNFKNIPHSTKELTMFNPRSKKDIILTDLIYKKEDDIFSAIDPKGKKIFLADYQAVADSWDDLFSINKAIYSGWWNRILIFNKPTYTEQEEIDYLNQLDTYCYHSHD